MKNINVLAIQATDKPLNAALLTLKGLMTESCYMCNRDASSKEHVPPKCLFPEMKDTKGKFNYREKLITVPSCEKHNTEKSKDDEYLMFLLASNILSNDHSKEHFLGKVMRAVKRKPHVFAAFAKNITPILLVEENGEKVHTGAFQIDNNRLNRAISHIAHGIYFYKFQKKFIGEVKVINEATVSLNSSDSININKQLQTFREKVNEAMKPISKEGENPDIFTFQYLEEDENKQKILRLTFYQKFKFTVLLKHLFQRT